MQQVVSSTSRVEGVALLPGDKSISHRAALLNSIAHGESHVSNFCEGDDRESMLRCLRGLGVSIAQHSSCPIAGSFECFRIEGNGPHALTEPDAVLDAGNSGTTMRLVTGLLAAQHFFSVISGDGSLRSRPMRRITEPLIEMGAYIMGRSNDSLAPLAIRGGSLRGIEYQMAVASAQVKSALLIAGLYATGETTIHQCDPSRDHTERMIRAMGGDLRTDGLTITVRPSKLSAVDVRVPGDISSATPWLVAACCHPNARVRLPRVGINPTRSGVLDVLQAMDANIRVQNVSEEDGEPVADLIAESSDLKATEISGELVPRTIDEIPALALAACFADGATVIRDAQELRVKESDRIRATVSGLATLGADIEETQDGMIIRGGRALSGAVCNSFGDHRIAMTMGVAGLLASGQTTVEDADAADVSYPGFWQTLHRIGSGRDDS